jgi:eukaryotic-like serine/threonine-protein kinase
VTQTVVQMRGNSGATSVPRGTRLNDIYEIDDQIAAGGMGEIYRGHLIETGDAVAIKMIKPELADNESVLALFRKEASALHQLHHDSIVRYYVFTVDRKINRPYLAMEFVEGRALSDILRERPLSFEEADRLRKRIASGLQAAHDKGIVHRDISPDNIILPEEDVRQAKIIDFGIARSTKLGQQTVIGDGFAGKYNYVSPEQLGLFGGNVTNKSDIYSLALVLSESLLGTAIDMSGSQADVIDKRRQVPDLSGIDKRIRPLLEHMLQPKPEDRPESMQAIVDWVASAEKVAATAGGSKSVLALAGALALSVAGAAGWYFTNGGSQNPGEATVAARPPTTTPQQVASVPSGLLAPPGLPVPLAPAEQASRVANYVRYYEGGQCLFLWPRDVSARSASIEALTGVAQSVVAFEADFRNVNGFAAQVTSARLSPTQCDVVPFLHRIDPVPDTTIRTEIRQRSLKAGERIQASISGIGTRNLEVLLIGEDGAVRNVTSQTRREREAIVLDARLDEPDRKPGTQTLLLGIISQNKINALSTAAKLAPSAFYAAIAEEVEKSGQPVAVQQAMIRFE